jgi:predicted regulator of Ras-like GTPase activity (Roadblock/LC7/MglB family)
MTSQFASTLQTLVRLRGVSAAMLVDEHEGLIIDAVLQFGQDGERVAAIAASLHRKARLAAEAAGLGTVAFMELEAESGRICLASRGGMVLLAVAASSANVGLVRIQLLKAVRGLA